MIKRIVFTMTFTLASVSLMSAQAHPPHAQGQPHDPSSHPTVDPQQHALLHGLLLGTWTGTLTSADGVATKLNLVAARDSHGDLALRVTGENLKQAKDVSLEGNTLRWTQAVSGAPCKAAGTLSSATDDAAGALKGTVGCKNEEMTFALQKTTN
jgi:hypothetical protein